MSDMDDMDDLREQQQLEAAGMDRQTEHIDILKKLRARVDKAFDDLELVAATCSTDDILEQCREAEDAMRAYLDGLHEIEERETP